MQAFLSGFGLGFTLLLAIGAQNIFILRQGLKRQHVLPVVLFCATSDALLIVAGVGGLGVLLAPIMHSSADWLFAGAALWLAGYGILRARDAINASGQALELKMEEGPSALPKILTICAVMTWGNPHVYLDTVLLLGSFSLPYLGMNKLCFAIGAVLASYLFFGMLGFGAQLLAPIMKSAKAWRGLDAVTAIIMLFFCVIMILQTSWFA